MTDAASPYMEKLSGHFGARARISQQRGEITLEADPATKTVRMSALPEPQILSIDHSLDYYDISEEYFTSYTPEDYNRINQRAKDLIREKADDSNLLPAAREQADKMLELIRFMAESAGWKLVIAGEPLKLGQ